jgi:hypothetical protein
MHKILDLEEKFSKTTKVVLMVKVNFYQAPKSWFLGMAADFDPAAPNPQELYGVFILGTLTVSFL